MIEYLQGSVVSRKPTSCVVDVGGVGYEVLIPTSTFEHVPAEGETFKFFTHHHVREDAEQLFGFSSLDERSVFRTLIGVSGVGPKLGLAALSAMRAAELRACVVSGDVAQLVRIPGVGRKTAERIIVDLRDRLAPPSDVSSAAPTASSKLSSARMDAVLALESLGLSRSAAEKQVAAVVKSYPETTSAEDFIRLALRDR